MLVFGTEHSMRRCAYVCLAACPYLQGANQAVAASRLAAGTPRKAGNMSPCRVDSCTVPKIVIDSQAKLCRQAVGSGSCLSFLV